MISSSASSPKIIYVARWHEDDRLRELRLDTPEIARVRDALTGAPEQLEEEVKKKAIGFGWLHENELLRFVGLTIDRTSVDSIASGLSCESHCLQFAHCPASEEAERKSNAEKRNPAWIEMRLNRRLALLNLITLILVMIQVVLLLQQNFQVDEALGKFSTMVEAYLWQVKTPALDAVYRDDTNIIELTNYGQTPVRITKAVLMTANGELPLLNGNALLLEGKSIELQLLHASFDALDIKNGVKVIVRYVYLGNRFQMTWGAILQFREGGPWVIPTGDPSSEPLTR